MERLAAALNGRHVAAIKLSKSVQDFSKMSNGNELVKSSSPSPPSPSPHPRRMSTQKFRFLWKRHKLDLGEEWIEGMDVGHIISRANGGADAVDNYYWQGSGQNRMIGNVADHINCFNVGLPKCTRAVQASTTLAGYSGPDAATLYAQGEAAFTVLLSMPQHVLEGKVRGRKPQQPNGKMLALPPGAPEPKALKPLSDNTKSLHALSFSTPPPLTTIATTISQIQQAGSILRDLEKHFFNEFS